MERADKNKDSTLSFEEFCIVVSYYVVYISIAHRCYFPRCDPSEARREFVEAVSLKIERFQSHDRRRSVFR